MLRFTRPHDPPHRAVNGRMGSAASTLSTAVSMTHGLRVHVEHGIKAANAPLMRISLDSAAIGRIHIMIIADLLVVRYHIYHNPSGVPRLRGVAEATTTQEVHNLTPRQTTLVSIPFSLLDLEIAAPHEATSVEDGRAVWRRVIGSPEKGQCYGYRPMLPEAVLALEHPMDANDRGDKLLVMRYDIDDFKRECAAHAVRAAAALGCRAASPVVHEVGQ